MVPSMPAPNPAMAFSDSFGYNPTGYVITDSIDTIVVMETIVGQQRAFSNNGSGIYTCIAKGVYRVQANAQFHSVNSALYQTTCSLNLITSMTTYGNIVYQVNDCTGKIQMQLAIDYLIVANVGDTFYVTGYMDADNTNAIYMDNMSIIITTI